MSPQMIVIIGLWLIFCAALVRAIQKGSLLQRTPQRIWMMFFLSILACTFWGEAAEIALDQHFHGQPVALYLKYVCLIGVCHLYRQMLREVDGATSESILLDYLALAAIGLGLFSFLVYTVLSPVSRSDLRFLVIGARDAVILLFILTSFFRGTLALWQQERVLAMRLKQAAIVLFFAFFAITTLGSISAAVMTLLHVGNPAWAARVLQPVLYPAIFFFVLMLIPYRWYAGLPHYQRLALYYRLKRLEHCVFRLVDARPNSTSRSWMVLQAEQLELAIYGTVISILDVYPLLPSTQALAARIQTNVLNNPHYDDLVLALARCMDD